MFRTGSVEMALIRLRPRQVRYQAALRPDICCFLDFKPLSRFPIPSRLPKSTQKSSDRGKTVTKPHQLTFSVTKPGRSSLAFRFSFCSASRFICSFICEYFLNTFASPCRSNCVTHSSATPPALRRVA
jgi:hypothetical protein